MLNERQLKKKALEEEFADLVGRPWPGRRYPGCYEVIQLYAKRELGRELKSFRGLYTSFKDEAVAEENGLWITKPVWGEDLDRIGRWLLSEDGGSCSQPRCSLSW